ncbi:MAG: hypothetical protein CFE23_10185 [Flavobacterium sp. BFFFF1]|uniref:T9SS sorting signal type C domain-containing protein n=1 Tax=Flavobacterium sp. BFFFF1 TaxID=2015557 RepID=UPI000BCF093C|nr:T9SS sorting signal type C domain-containing protein [Flavobacterium sp. BFFFF1]OYU80265.1 MAG: hypothetical protein CFE23_10185 [Flavobacterium sp. BFFFF1]
MKRLLLIFLIPFLGFSQISGTKIIGSSQAAPYTNLTLAIAYVNTVGVNGPTTFLIDNDQTAATSLIINQFTGTSATNTLTIKPNTGKTITISGAISNGAVIQFNGADNIIINGNNGTSDKQLTVYNTFSDSGNSYTSRAAVWMYGGATNNKVTNAILRTNIIDASAGTLSVGLLAGSSSMGGAQDNSNNEVSNNTFTTVKQAVYINGNSASNTNWTISSNMIGAASDASKPYLGIYLNNITTYTLSGNTIDGVKRPNGVGGTAFHSGIYVSGASTGTISGNTVSNIENASGSNICYGLYVSGSTTSVTGNTVTGVISNSTNDGNAGISITGSNATIANNKIYTITMTDSKLMSGIFVSGNSALVYNNMIGNVSSAGGGSPNSQSGNGIYIDSGTIVKVYYNTVRLATNQSTGASACLFINGGTQLDIRNNLFINAQSSGSTRFCVYSTVTTTSSFTNIDYNDYYSSQYIGSWGSFYTATNLKTTLAQWQAVTSKDANSINVSATFTAATDLHLSATQASLVVGTPISGFTTDIDGDTRNNPSTVGADEYAACSGGTTTWNGTTWSNGTPTATIKAVINGAYNTTTHGDIITCELTVNSGKTLTITPGKVVEIQNNLTNNGTINIQDKGSLVQVSDASTVSGNITLTRTTTSLKPYDYTYFSSPVSGSVISNVIADTYYNFTFDPSINNWVSQPQNAVMTVGKGYCLRAPETLNFNPTATFNAVFAGVPNNGIINVPVTKTAACPYNLIGNPYPSAVDADLFLGNATNASKLTGVIYLWTHNTAISANNPGSETYNYTTNDYAKYNLTGPTKGVAAASGGVLPTGKIASGQGFFVETTGSNTTSNLVFNNGMRVKTTNSNGNFYRTANTTEETQGTIEKNRLWVSISNTEGAYDETLLGYVTGASNDLDYGYDGKTFDAGNYVMIYSILNGEKLCIQGKDVNFNANDVIPLGFKTSLTGQLTIGIEKTDGFFAADQDVYLLDKTTNVLTDLKQGSYTFTQDAAGIVEDRFELRFTNAPLGVENPVFDQNTVQVITHSNQLQVNSTLSEIKAVTVYDLLGRMVYTNNKVNSLDFTTGNITATNQTLIVKVKTDTAEVTRKIIMK